MIPESYNKMMQYGATFHSRQDKHRQTSGSPRRPPRNIRWPVSWSFRLAVVHVASRTYIKMILIHNSTERLIYILHNVSYRNIKKSKQKWWRQSLKGKNKQERSSINKKSHTLRLVLASYGIGLTITLFKSYQPFQFILTKTKTYLFSYSIILLFYWNNWPTH